MARLRFLIGLLLFSFLIGAAAHAQPIKVDFNENFSDCCFGPNGYSIQKQGISLFITNGYVVGWNHIGVGTPYYTISPNDCFGCGRQASLFFSSRVAKVKLSLRGLHRDNAPLKFVIGGQVSPFTITIPSGAWQEVSPPLDGVQQFTIQREDSLSFGLDDLSFEPFAPPVFSFDLGPQSPEKQRRVLIHKYRADDFYPSTEQTADGAIQIRGRVTSGGTPVAGKTVYFRVVDPPDTALYTVVNQHAHPGDNDDSGRGNLTAPAATTDANGVVRTTLLTTTYAGGDNYVVEASFDPRIVTDPNYFCSNGSTCWKSGTFTAWKRVYVEVNKMFRRGQYLRSAAAAGSKVIAVDDIDDLTVPMKIKLIHAPPVDGAGVFYEEDVTISKVVKVPKPQPSLLVLDPKLHPNGLSHSFDGSTKVLSAANTDPRRYLADAFGVLTNDSKIDYYLPAMHLVAPLFEEAFVEHVWLIDSVAAGTNVASLAYSGFLPFNPDLRGGAEGKDKKAAINEVAWLARKWTHHAQRDGIDRATAPNHQILFAAANHIGIPNEDRGLTIVGGGSNDTWVYVPTYESDTQLAEGVAHELAHSWLVNQINPLDEYYGGHCDSENLSPKPYPAFNDPNKMCLMTSTVFKSSESSDGKVAFHYLIEGGNVPDSEYLRIRKRTEPVPQSELPREDPQ